MRKNRRIPEEKMVEKHSISNTQPCLLLPSVLPFWKNRKSIVVKYLNGFGACAPVIRSRRRPILRHAHNNTITPILYKLLE